MGALTVGELFAGIGGFGLGLERAGMRVVWQCERDDFCRRVLAKHWPDVPCFEDVRDLSGAAGTPPVDVLCGGFPCQDISRAGAGAGIGGARSGLWSEFARLAGELRPRYIIVENVTVLRSRGLDRILADLAALGFDAEWDCVPACAVGAPQIRDRLFLVAYPGGTGLEGRRRPVAGAGEVDLAAGLLPPARPWPDEPDVPRVVDGLPRWVDRMKATGNTLVPQIAEWIGRRIIDWEAGSTC